MVQVTVDADALRSDAKKWDDASTDMHNAGGSARNLVLTDSQLGKAADLADLVSTYQTLQQRIVRLLQGAESAFDKTAGTLRTVANEYERSDVGSADDLRRVEE